MSKATLKEAILKAVGESPVPHQTLCNSIQGDKNFTQTNEEEIVRACKELENNGQLIFHGTNSTYTRPEPHA